MKKISKTILLILSIITILMTTSKVEAENITTDQVITFMQSNNLFEDEEYFRLFGVILNGDNEYDITSFKYTIEKNASDISIDVTLNDKNTGEIKRSTILAYTNDTISYTNPRSKDTLESRIDTILLTQIMYSIGGARGYNKNTIINWMNQVNLNNSVSSDGIDSEVEKVKFNYEINSKKQVYTLDVPKNYTIRINEITNTVPKNDYITITETKKSISSITLRVFADGNLGEECEIFRLSDGTYKKIATVSCNNGEYTDENLKDNTEYTYQATIKNKIVCSDNRIVKTNEVPPTGGATYLIVLTVLLSVSTGLLVLFKKRNPLKKV